MMASKKKARGYAYIAVAYDNYGMVYSTQPVLSVASALQAAKDLVIDSFGELGEEVIATFTFVVYTCVAQQTFAFEQAPAFVPSPAIFY